MAIGWAISAVALIGFMFYTLADPSANAAEFRDAATPWISAADNRPAARDFYWLATNPARSKAHRACGAFADILFERVLALLADMVRRYWLWALPVLALAMTYRIADSIWGSFANPFYVGIMSYSNSDVAVASKMVGVFMTLAGIALGGAWRWRGLTHAIADYWRHRRGVDQSALRRFARGGAWIDGFLRATGLGAVFDWALRGFVGAVNGAGARFLRESRSGRGSID